MSVQLLRVWLPVQVMTMSTCVTTSFVLTTLKPSMLRRAKTDLTPLFLFASVTWDTGPTRLEGHKWDPPL